MRGGVAPLRSSSREEHLKYIPPTARWTKINKNIVSLEVLELGKERFDAREDEVIVLRVLSAAEVRGYVEVSQKIKESTNFSSRSADTI